MRPGLAASTASWRRQQRFMILTIDDMHSVDNPFQGALIPDERLGLITTIVAACVGASTTR